VRATVPAAWAGSPVDLVWVTGTESTLWREGRPVHGLARERTACPVDGEQLALSIELACNDQPAELVRCEIARRDPEAWHLLHDFRVLAELEADAAHGLDPTWAGELLHELNRFCNVWAPDDRATWPAAAAILAPLLGRRNATRVHELFAIGHAHLDTAWLWPLDESYRKCQRTFTTQLALLRAYPEHRFACSSAQHYAWVRDRDADLYAEIREAVADGRWVPVGGTWVEPDCNLPAGESLARQFLYGQRFFERELGRRATELWNPDVFGYAGQLPQIMRAAGIARFLTQKLSWNRFTTPPSHTFAWEGIDGSRVVTHFPPADTYNARADVAELRRSARAYRDHDRSRHSLLVFGHGDGGGGPTPEMLETLRRARDLQGLPRTTIASSEAFFEALEDDAEELAVIVGELYFEFHRGTYTSQAAIKRANRRCEAVLHDAEFLATAAAAIAGSAYPGDELGELWRTLLLHQFHDILPGSSIGEVYAEAAPRLEALERDADALRHAAGTALTGAGDEPIPINTIGAPREELAERPDGTLAFVVAPPYGLGRCGRAPDGVRLEARDGGYLLANAALAVELAHDGSVVSLRLAASGREALAAPGNRFELYEDLPLQWDAWDVDPFHLETGRPCAGAHAHRVVRADDLRAEIAFDHVIGAASRLTQVVRLDAGARRLELHTEVRWRERHRLLKVAFPLLVHAERASYEMPFGHAERPTHFSTAADLARYEVPGHRWADLSEHGFGVALLNDGKYGHSAHGNVLRLSLLRAPTHPDPEADQGDHRFAYAVLPHAGDWRTGGVVAEARRFNQPLVWSAGLSGTEPRSLASVDDDNLVLDTIKRAEDGDAVVLRLYEAHGGRGTARVRLALPFAGACRANLLEDPGDELEVDGEEIVVSYRPHEIITLIARPARIAPA
jgi:alpha-mannosidase